MILKWQKSEENSTEKMKNLFGKRNVSYLKHKAGKLQEHQLFKMSKMRETFTINPKPPDRRLEDWTKHETTILSESQELKGNSKTVHGRLSITAIYCDNIIDNSFVDKSSLNASDTAFVMIQV